MKKKLLVIILCLVGIFSFQERLYAYSLDVHEEITKRTIKQNKDKLNKYINDYAGLTNGVDEFINNKKIIDLIKDGSWKEDFNWSWNNNLLFSHFYNPVTNTSGVGLWPSAYDWANASNNNWSWQKTRDYFYQGLTLATKLHGGYDE